MHSAQNENSAEVITALAGAPRSEGGRAGWERANDNRRKRDAILVCDVQTAQLDVWQGHDAGSRSRRRRRLGRVLWCCRLLLLGGKGGHLAVVASSLDGKCAAESVAEVMREISQKRAIRRRRRRL